MTDLLRTPTADQQFLLNTIGDAFLYHHQWPIWQYLEEGLAKRNLQPAEILHSLPVVGDGQPLGMRYGLVWFDRFSLRPDSKIKLTAAGIYHVPALRVPVERFFVELIRVLAERRRSARFSPVEIVTVKVTQSDIEGAFPGRDRALLARVPELLDVEPPTMVGSKGTLPNDGGWYRELGRGVSAYAHVKDLKEYIERVSDRYTPKQPVTTRSVPSPLDLVASIDYYNVVWQLQFGKPIMQFHNAERLARLAFPVSSSDEFMAQISGFAELFKNLQVNGDPTVDKTPLARLKTVLSTQLPDKGTLRANEAVAVLGRVVELRNSLVHIGTEYRGARALAELGIGYPVADWAAAWVTVQERVIDALAVLREEIQFLSGQSD